MIQSDGEEHHSDEFKRDAVALYRDTGSATITVIAAELGVSEATLSVCAKPGCADPARRSASAGVVTPGGESPEQELARLRAEIKALCAEQTKLATERDILAVGGQIFRRGDEPVSRFQFVADHRDTFEVEWLCKVVDVARSSFCAWCDAADHQAARHRG